MSWKNAQSSRVWTEISRQLEREVPSAVISLDHPTTKMATLRAGGPAAMLVTIHTVEDVQALQEFCKAYKLPTTVLSGMSNTLIRDAGYDGVAIKLSGEAFTKFDVVEQGDKDLVTFGAAVPTGKLVQQGKQRGWTSMAPLAGIPGYLGGAVAMNAGSRGVWISEFVSSIQLVLSDGKVVTRGRDAMKFGYRTSAVGTAIVIGGELSVLREDVESAKAAFAESIERRNATQPTGTKNCGSVFRNPDGDSAGRLIEAVGLKGVRLHGARVSPKHANFIENLGDATATDIEALCNVVNKKVRDETGIELQRELRIIGQRVE